MTFSQEQVEAMQGILDKDSTVKLEVSHEVLAHGVRIETIAREWRVVPDSSRDTEVCKLKSLEINGVKSQGEARLYRAGYSAVPTGRQWSRSKDITWDDLLHNRESMLRLTIEECCRQLVQLLTSMAVESALQKIMGDLPPRLTTKLGPITHIRPSDLKRFEECPRRFFHQYEAKYPMPRGHGKSHARAAAEAHPDGNFKLPIDKMTQPKRAPVECDKKFATCRDKFHNEENFGVPLMPGQRVEDLRCPHRLYDSACGVDPSVTVDDLVTDAEEVLGAGFDLADGPDFTGFLTVRKKTMNGSEILSVEGESADVTATVYEAQDHAAVANGASVIPIGDGFGEIKGNILHYEGRAVGRVKSWVHDEVQIEVFDPEVRKLLGKPWTTDQQRVEVVEGTFKPKVTHVDYERLEREALQGASPECDVCWNTGFIKGSGGPCTEGCKPPRK